MTDGGLWCCKMRIHRLSPSVQQMIDDWLDYYRRLSQLHQAASAALTRYGDSGSGASGSGTQQASKSSKSNSARKATSPPVIASGTGNVGCGNEGQWEIGKIECQQDTPGETRRPDMASEGGRNEGEGQEENSTSAVQKDRSGDDGE